MRCTTVRILFSTGSPSHVARLVIPIIIRAFQCMLRGRAQPHILQKGLKGLLPGFIDRNPTAPVAMKRFVARACTTVKHVKPCIIFSFVCNSIAMFREVFTGRFTVQGPLVAAATDCRAGSQRLSANFFLYATNTLTQVAATGAWRMGNFSEDCEITKWHANSNRYFGFHASILA